MKSLKSSYACFRNVVTPRKVENLRWIAKIFQRRCNHNKRFSGLHKDRWMFDLCQSSWYESRPRFLLDFGLVGLADPLENRKKFGLRVLTFFHFFRHVFCFCFASWQSYWVLVFLQKSHLWKMSFLTFPIVDETNEKVGGLERLFVEKIDKWVMNEHNTSINQSSRGAQIPSLLSLRLHGVWKSHLTSLCYL